MCEYTHTTECVVGRKCDVDKKKHKDFELKLKF